MGRLSLFSLNPLSLRHSCNALTGRGEEREGEEEREEREREVEGRSDESCFFLLDRERLCFSLTISQLFLF